MEKETPSLLNIYPQRQWNTNAFIMGNKEGLIALKKAIEDALENPNKTGKTEISDSDGKNFNCYVKLNNDEKQSASWNKNVTPYIR